MKLFERLNAGTIDREVRGVRAVADRTFAFHLPRNVFERLKKMTLADIAALSACPGKFRERQGTRRHEERFIAECFSVLECERCFIGSDLRSDDVQEVRFKAQVFGGKGQKAAVKASGISNAEFARRGNAQENVFKRLNFRKFKETLLVISDGHEVGRKNLRKTQARFWRAGLTLLERSLIRYQHFIGRTCSSSCVQVQRGAP